MDYFSINLRDGDGTVEKLGMLPFASIDEVDADVRAAIPDAAADLVRKGNNPFHYCFLICDSDDNVLREVPLDSALRSSADGKDGNRTSAE